ncbi:hypothetical protein AB685_12230 [Bacillus sp. LL01]|uniref:flagellar assembly protein FliH n=1 Tax=Bacillus sp. LL01 TaxID=1665556 RepID=UPI00064D581B|nr:flagellar assembly protein FliH [Bacillus sp. LL01]KMJ58638.1 hypothetical protein AB685_12230 [Bacillus sp. LL01]
MSKLIKSSYLNEAKTGSVAIKVAPIFSRKQTEAQMEIGIGHNIEYINQTIAKAKQEAVEIVAEANQKREFALKEMDEDKRVWEIEKESWKQQAYAQGQELGYQDGKKEAHSQYEERLAEAQQIIDLAKEEHQKKLDSSIESIVLLSIKVAEKILGHTLESDSSFFTKLVQTALKEVKEKDEIRIYVSPKQYPYFIQNKQLLQNIINSQYDLAIYPEAVLADDGCWIDSSAGRMEVSVQTQLVEIKEHLLQLVRTESSK